MVRAVVVAASLAHHAVGGLFMPIRLVPVFDLASLGLFASAAQADSVPSVIGTRFWEGPAGFLIAGAGFATYWLVKAVVEAKTASRPSQPVFIQQPGGNVEGLTAIFSKMQEVLDAQKASQDALTATLQETTASIRSLQGAMLEHDAYVKTHVGERGREIVRTLGEDMAPLIVNSIRTAFEAQDVRKVASRDTDPVGRKPARKRKTRS